MPEVQDLANRFIRLNNDEAFIEKNVRDGYVVINDNTSDEDRTRIEDIRGDCDGVFIDTQGDCRWISMTKFKNLTGFRVVAGEQDSFGWLTGVVVTPNFRFVYG